MGEIWISLFGGVLLGVVLGWAGAWRMALKLERCGVGLAEWDATDARDPHWQAYALKARASEGQP
jgi:hypothetical protein